MIAIIDYGMGNLRSVEKGFQHVGVDARVVTTAREVADASGVVLPGVGAFRDCMQNLGQMGLIEPVKKSIADGKPFLGICLGLQALFTESEEFGHTEGLGVLKGRVPRFPRSELKVPHMGWNSITIRRRPPIMPADVPDGAYFYFVHSYYVAPEDEGIIATTTDYGLTFTSMVWKDNVFATQFHPEKSQALGLKVLKGFGEFVDAN